MGALAQAASLLEDPSSDASAPRGAAPASSEQGGGSLGAAIALLEGPSGGAAASPTAPRQAAAANRANNPAAAMERDSAAAEGAAVPLQAAAHLATGFGSSIVGGWRGLATLATGGSLEDAAQAVHQTAQEGTYRPESGTVGGDVADALDSPWNPLNWPGVAGKALGERAQDRGASPEAASGIETAANVVPMLLGFGRGKAPMRLPSRAVVDADVVAPKQTSLAAIGHGENLDIPTVLRRNGGRVAVEVPGRTPLALMPKEGEPAQVATPAAPKPVLSLAEREPRPEKPASTFDKAEAAPAQLDAPSAKVDADGRVKPAPAADFTEEPSSGPDRALPESEQAKRAALLQRVGFAGDVRRSVLTGDKTAGSTEYQMSGMDSEAGRHVKTALDQERQTLVKHAEALVHDTGGSLGTDAASLYSRGNAILAPLDELKGWFDRETKNLYSEADKRANGAPLEMEQTHKLVGGDQAEFLGTQAGQALLQGVKARMKSLGMVDDGGAPKPATVERAERLKQYLNEVWQPSTGRLIRTLKDSIDTDVTRAAGEDIYAKARAMRAMRGATLDNPNGIAKIMDASGPQGINRAVPVEKVADAVAGLPADQLAHVVKVLQNVPVELRPQARAAIGEIKAHFANRILEAGNGKEGQWASRDVTRYLQRNAARLPQLFTADDLARIRDLNDAGQILRNDTRYPGAAVQEHNLVRAGAMTAVRAGAAGVGALVGGAAGAMFGFPGMGASAGGAAGSMAGNAATRALQDRAALGNARKRFTSLRDFPK